MNIIGTCTKRPGADCKLDYSIQWYDWLVDGDAIATFRWEVTGATASVTPVPVLIDGVATVWIEGGEEDTECIATCFVTTTEGLRDYRSIRILIRN